MWDGSIDSSFIEAGVLQGSTGTFWYSASDSSGNYDTVNNCENWTTTAYNLNATTPRMRRGNPATTNSGWISNERGRCDYAGPIICVAW